MIRTATIIATLALATPALADPCKAIPDRGPMPSYLKRGATFSGPVSYVGDGDSLCVAVGQGAANWVEVRVEDFFAPEIGEEDGPATKALLAQLVMGRRLTCVAEKRSYDRVVATCRLGSRSVGDLMRQAGAPEGGRGQ